MNAEEKLVIGIGELLWDCLPEGRRIGGAPANFAYHAMLMGQKAMAVSAIGRDELGREAESELQARGLKYELPEVGFPTGTVGVELDQNGVPTYDIRRGVAWDHIPFTPALESIAHECGCVCFGSLAQRAPESRETISRFIASTPQGCIKIFDINLRQHFYDKPTIEQSLRAADILKINDEEITIVATMLGMPTAMKGEEISRQLIALYALRMVILTRGASGSDIYTTSGIASSMSAPRIHAVDTVGAGDSFTAAFAAGLLSGASIPQTHAMASALSAYVCTQSGAMPPIPDGILKQIKKGEISEETKEKKS